MPLPQASRTPSAALSASRRVLFVSYSHADMAEFGVTLIQYLILKLRGNPDPVYAESDVFSTSSGCARGDWDEFIQLALERGFNQGMLAWSGSVLPVLIKGLIEHRPPRFWGRLR